MEIIPGVLDLPLWSILLTIATVLGYIYSTWTFNTWSKQGIKGNRPLPLLGSFLTAMFEGGFAMEDPKLLKKYGRISGSYRGRIPSLDVADPEFLRLTMIKEFASMPNRSSIGTGDKIMDNFLTTLSDDHWRHVRASLTPTFTSGKLKQMKTRIDDCADTFVEHIAENGDEPFDSKKFTGGYTMDVISSTAFGIQVDSQKDPNHPMLVNGNKVMGINPNPTILDRAKQLFAFLIFLLAPQIVLKVMTKLGINLLFDQNAARYFGDITDKIITERGENAVKQKDFVQLCVNSLIENPSPNDPETKVDQYGQKWSTKGLTKDEIISNAVLFFLAGYETTAATLNFILYELTMHPEVQAKAYKEIMDIKSGEVATYEELAKMEYIDWIINETMRLYPAAPRVDRLLCKDTTIEGIHLPKGSIVCAMIYAIHHDPEQWPEPEKFDPERFSPENSEGRHQYAWLPFGIGNRNCIGMRLALLEIKIALVKILTNFTLEPCEGTPERPIKLAKDFRMNPEKAVQIKASRRKAVAED